MSNLRIALEVMGKGMAGIFAVIIIIMIFVMLLGKLTQIKTPKENIEKAGEEPRENKSL